MAQQEPQALTPQVRAWLAEQSALGYSPQDLFQAMLVVGWQPEAAASALSLDPPEVARLLLQASADGSQAPDGPLPQVLPDVSGMIDAGDKWVEVRDRRQIPPLCVFGSLLSASECTELMEAARPRLSRSLTVDVRTGGDEVNEDRTSQGMFFARGETPLIQRIETRLARLLNWPIENGEGLQVLRYPPSAQYRPHYDYFDPAEPGTAAILQRGGQRVATLIMYLNEPEAGGATVFPDIGLSVPPKQGCGVFFSYAQPHPASLTLHGGNPVEAGEKWIATKWLRERQFV